MRGPTLLKGPPPGWTPPPGVELDWVTSADDEEVFAEAAEEVEKHLPGQHNQLDHGRGRGHAPAPTPPRSRAPDVTRDELAKMTHDAWRNIESADGEDVRAYTAYNFRDINGYLRDPSQELTRFNTREQVEAYIDGIDGAMAASPGAPRDMTLYRGVSVRGKAGAESHLQLEEGFTFPDQGFTSVTTSEDYAEEWANHMVTRPRSISHEREPGVIALRVPKGTKMLPVGDQSTEPREQEIIIDRGHTYRITSQPVRGDDGVWRMEGEIVEG